MTNKPRYQIIITRNKEQIKYISTFKNVISANTKYLKMIEGNNKSIVFPVRYVNTKGIKPVSYEILIIKEVGDDDDEFSMIKNETGGYVKTVIKEKYDENSKYGKSNKGKFVVYDAHAYNFEETFWLYGFHPRFHRMTFAQIFEEIVINKIKGKKHADRITVYKNKVLFENERDIDIVICKCVSDAIRFYNMVSSWCDEKKIHNMIFNGKAKKYEQKFFIEKIAEKTGWKKTKIIRSSTRP